MSNKMLPLLVILPLSLGGCATQSIQQAGQEYSVAYRQGCADGTVAYQQWDGKFETIPPSRISGRRVSAAEEGYNMGWDTCARPFASGGGGTSVNFSCRSFRSSVFCRGRAY